MYKYKVNTLTYIFVPFFCISWDLNLPLKTQTPYIGDSVSTNKKKINIGNI